MTDLHWILLFYGAGIAAMFIELLVPGVVMGVIGFLAVCGSVVYAFTSGHSVAGGILVATTIAFIPLFFMAWRHVLSRFWMLRNTEEDFSSSTVRADELMAREGQATSPLRPSGVAIIEDQRVAVITRGEMLEKGTRVKVIDVSGNKITVKKV